MAPQYFSALYDRVELCFDTIPIHSLLLVAIAFRFGARRFGYSDLQLIPCIFASLFFVAYFLHGYRAGGNGFANVFSVLVRSLFAYHIVWGACMIAVGSVYLIRRLNEQLRSIIDTAVKRWRFRLTIIRLRVHNRFKRPLPKVVVPPPPAPVPRAVILRRQAEDAEADFAAEVAALEGLSLDEDEREMLIYAAKQRLIRKLHREN